MERRSTSDQLNAAHAALRAALGSAGIVGAYLYGSAGAGGLRPDSDLDLLVVTHRSLEPAEKRRLVDGLLPISRRGQRPSGWRPLEVTVVAQDAVRPWHYPPRMELQYGEWLRDVDLADAIEAEPAANPDLGVLVAMVRQGARALIGPEASEVLGAVPRPDLVRAMIDGIPGLLADLEDDTRNVLLTLVRIWATMATGGFYSKDAAADWALAQLPAHRGPMLAHARDLYRNGGYGEWPDTAAVRDLAAHIVREIHLAAD